MDALPQPANDDSLRPRLASPATEGELLSFERHWPRHSGAKEEAIRSQFDLSAARYYQLLNALIDSPSAVKSDPMLVARLQRNRGARSAARAASTFRTSDRGGHVSPDTPRNE